MMDIMNRTYCMLQRVRHDERGTITIEFLLWLPVFIFWIVISVSSFDAFRSRDEAAKAAHTLSDIMSRQTEVTDTFFTELSDLQDKLLPRAPASKWLRVTSVMYTGGDYQVQWSRSLGGGIPLTNDDIPLALLPTMADLDTVVITEVHSPYQPIANYTGITVTEWGISLVSRPRFVSEIAMIN
jgi:Flp pilus assembly protein TadG